MSTTVLRGASAVTRLLADLHDVRWLEPRAFTGWLDRHLAVWRTDSTYLQRTRIRDLRRAHPELQALEAERALAREAYETSASYERLEALTRELAGAENGVAGLAHARGRAEDPAEVDRLSEKHEAFAGRVDLLRAELRQLMDASPERVALDAVVERLARARVSTGFDEAIASLAGLQRKGGRSTGRSGSAFESTALAAVRTQLLQELGDESLLILQGVTFGAARTEIDQLVIRPGPLAGEPVEVVAMVEAKRNPNDLARGARRRIENLAWLAGYAGGYDPASYRTGSFPLGHFDSVVVHGVKVASGRRDLEKGAASRPGSHLVTRDSFRNFLPDLAGGHLPRSLYLITRAAPLWGIGSAALARLAHRVASDLDWNPDDPAYIAGLLAWTRSLSEPVESPDILRRYLAEPAAADRIIVVEG